MMCKEAYVTDRGDHNLAHLMFHTSPLNGAGWGAALLKSRVMLNSQFKGMHSPGNVVGRSGDPGHVGRLSEKAHRMFQTLI